MLAPVHEGMCKYESLKDGTLDLDDVATMVESLMVRADNLELRRERERKNGNNNPP